MAPKATGSRRVGTQSTIPPSRDPKPVASPAMSPGICVATWATPMPRWSHSNSIRSVGVDSFIYSIPLRPALETPAASVLRTIEHFKLWLLSRPLEHLASHFYLLCARRSLEVWQQFPQSRWHVRGKMKGQIPSLKNLRLDRLSA